VCEGKIVDPHLPDGIGLPWGIYMFLHNEEKNLRALNEALAINRSHFFKQRAEKMMLADLARGRLI